MKKRVFAIIVVLVIVSMVSPGASHAVGSAKHYTVYWNPGCPVGPSPPSPHIVGEWDVDCEGNWTGWGLMPGEACTRSVITILYYCPQ
jgi:hypothetical protein